MSANPKKLQWLRPLIYLLVIALLWYSLQRVPAGPQPKQISYSEFLSEVRAGHVSDVRIDEQQFIAKLKTDPSKQEPAKEISTQRLPAMDETPLLKDLEAQGVTFSGHTVGSTWWSLLLPWVIPILFFAVITGYGSRKLAQKPGGLTFGKSRAKIHDQSSAINVSFKDVAGVDEAKAELMEVVDFLKQPAKYQQLGGRIPKGVLLVGPPGTGKTLLAKAVSGEAGVPFFSISGSEFIEMFVGVGAARVRDLFEQAKQKAPCIIFIDELDAIGKSRAGSRGGMFTNDEREQTLNQLLAEMDGFDTSKGVIIIAATNTPEVLDAALLRAGRFDRQIIVDRPDLEGREAILKIHVGKIKLSPDVDLKVIAARTPGMVGADLANIVNEAALLAVRRDADQVQMRDLEEAIDRVMLGLEKKNRVMTASDKERVAYHEAGHALVALSVEHAAPVYRVSIIPRSVGALGHTLQLPTEERYLMTLPELEDQITVMMGGQAAEESIYHGVISTGARDDLQRASELIRLMVMRFGMSERLGHLTYGAPQNAQFLRFPFVSEERNYSEKTSEAIDAEVRRISDELYLRAKTILTRRRAELEAIALELMQKETLDRRQIDLLLPSPFKQIPA
ncbi:MAG: cell division protein FtsH [Acidobacteria bacterium]|nr:MAG: cell division protein FtsH [Acidobacteriota bacterium]